MINFDEYVNENKTEHNKNWPYVPDHPYRILIAGGSGSGKTNLLLNLIENQADINKIYFYTKDPYESISISTCAMSTKKFMITILIKKRKYR